MTVAVVDRSAPRGRIAARSSAREGLIRLGMPQLAWGGLSETWLLRELGHRHWTMIADAAGRDVPAFVDGAGRPAYAAFCGVSVEDAAFDALGEHDELAISSDLGRVSGTQFASSHRLSKAGRPVGRVDLSSVFVARGTPGRNRSIARVAVAGLPPSATRPDFVPITTLATAVRAGAWSSHFGFAAADEVRLGRHVIDPCPSQDFNGAGFLYFTSYQAFVDRAEWALLGAARRPATTLARDIVFLGNVDPGEAVVVEVLGLRRSEDRFAHRCRVSTTDGRALAEVFTSRSMVG